VSARAAAVGSRLRPGVDEARLKAAEGLLGLALPLGLRQLYLRHDGERLPEGAADGVFARMQFLSLDALCALVQERRRHPQGPVDVDVHGPVEAVSWSFGWLPFARDFGDNFLAVDVSASAGEPGQVVYLGFDDGRLEVVAPSLKSFLEEEAGLLESGARQVEAAAGRAVTVRLSGVSTWKPGDVLPVPGHPLEVVVVDPGATGRAARTMATGLCLVVTHQGQALSFAGVPRVVGARLMEAGVEVSSGLGTAPVELRGEAVTCLLLPAPALTAGTTLVLELVTAS
jgi:cell wall assembly regulator SMI1